MLDFEEELKKFHGIMTKYIVEESGDFRSGEEGVFNDEMLKEIKDRR